MKIFISGPMRGRTNEEIIDAIERAKGELTVAAIENDEPIEFVDNFIPVPENDDIKNISAWCLGKAIQKIAKCDAVYFCPGWAKARGCVIERTVALLYGITRLYQDESGVIYQESAE